MPEIGLLEWNLAWGAVLVGTVIQRLTGAGFGMVAAPLLALIVPGLLPVAILLVGVVVGLSASALNFQAIEKRDLVPGFIGRTLGAVIAAVLAVKVVQSGGIELAIGVVIWGAILLSVSGMRLPLNAPTLFGAGTTAGIMGTLTGVGAPPMAIIYARTEPKRSAATQNVFFGFGMVVSISALAWQGLVRAEHLWFAAGMLPAVPAGFILARPFIGRIEKGSLRPWAFGLSGAAATALILRQLF